MFGRGLADGLQRIDPQNVLCTTLYSSEQSVDYASRMAKLLARRMGLPVYLGCSVKFPGLLTTEEVESFMELTRAIMTQWNQYVSS